MTSVEIRKTENNSTISPQPSFELVTPRRRWNFEGGGAKVDSICLNCCWWSYSDFFSHRRFSFLICWPNSEVCPHGQNIYWGFPSHQYLLENILSSLHCRGKGKMFLFVYFYVRVCEVWLPKDYVFWLESLSTSNPPFHPHQCCTQSSFSENLTGKLAKNKPTEKLQ